MIKEDYKSENTIMEEKKEKYVCQLFLVFYFLFLLVCVYCIYFNLDEKKLMDNNCIIENYLDADKNDFEKDTVIRNEECSMFEEYVDNINSNRLIDESMSTQASPTNKTYDDDVEDFTYDDDVEDFEQTNILEIDDSDNLYFNVDDNYIDNKLKIHDAEELIEEVRFYFIKYQKMKNILIRLSNNEQLRKDILPNNYNAAKLDNPDQLIEIYDQTKKKVRESNKVETIKSFNLIEGEEATAQHSNFIKIAEEVLMLSKEKKRDSSNKFTNKDEKLLANMLMKANTILGDDGYGEVINGTRF